MMAPQQAAVEVHGKAGVAVGAAGHPAAIVTGQHRREAAAVEEQQTLMTGVQVLLQQPNQSR